MCKKCLALTKKYFKGVHKKSVMAMLWECTCFPFGTPEQLEPQLKAIANRRLRGGKKSDWLMREIGLAQRRAKIFMNKIKKEKRNVPANSR